MPGNKRKAPAGTDSQQKRSTVSSSNFFSETIAKVESDLVAKANEQKDSAKEQNWSYDPRPAVKCTASTSQLLVELNSLGTLVDSITKAFSETAQATVARFTGDNLVEQARDALQTVVSKDNDAAEGNHFKEDQLFAFAVHNWIESIEASTFDAKCKQAKNAKEVVDALVAAFTNVILNPADFSIPSANSPFKVTRMPKVKPDPADSGSRWFVRFYRHMQWLYRILDERQCHSIGRIKTAVRDEKHMHAKVRAFVEDTTALGDNTFIDWVIQKYARISPTHFAHLTQEQARRLAVFEILHAPMNPRTYFGSFCRRTRESDYDGCRSGIAVDAAEGAEASGHLYRFVVCSLMGKSIEETKNEMKGKDFFPNTASFYVPGMQEDD